MFADASRVKEEFPRLHAVNVHIAPDLDTLGTGEKVSTGAAEEEVDSEKASGSEEKASREKDAATTSSGSTQSVGLKTFGASANDFRRLHTKEVIFAPYKKTKIEVKVVQGFDDADSQVEGAASLDVGDSQVEPEEKTGDTQSLDAD